MSELRLLRAIDELENQLREVGDVQRAARIAVRLAGGLMHADDVCVALLTPGREDAFILQGVMLNTGRGSSAWDTRLLAQFARGHKVEAPRSMALGRLKRRGRPWGVIALRWLGSDPGWDIRHALTRIATATNTVIEHIDRQRTAEVRSRIDRKSMEQLRPKDLFYQILDGLRSLTGYDHTGTLYAVDALEPGDDVMEIAAEQIAWQKGKSDRIGRRLPLTQSAAADMNSGGVWGFSHEGDAGWVPWDPATPVGVVEWVRSSNPGARPGAPPESELICAALRANNELSAVLRLSAQHHGTVGTYEAGLVESFLPHALIAIQNARRAESLADRVIQAERKHAMAELARGVSHDVNNALGSILPLVQQLREEAEQGTMDPATAAADLAQIERSVQVCTRIFNGMLRMARRSAHEGTSSRARIAPALESALAILGDGCRRSRVEILQDVPADLPEVPLAQNEAEQVLLNLIANARDAMAVTGGELLIRAAAIAQGTSPCYVRVEVADTGAGIPGTNLHRIFEPFFSTKPSGNGLGLAICRSIIWQAQGRLDVESPARTTFTSGGPGTRFIVVLPALGEHS